MKPAPFTYEAPTTLEEALDQLGAHGFEAKLLAGGQSLIPVMNFRLAQPAVLIDLNTVAGLDGLHVGADGRLRVGGMVRQATLERSPLVREHAPLVFETMPHIAHPQIRNRGTIGGSLAHADPAGELPVLSVALEASFKLQNSAGERWVPAGDFYRGLFDTALEEDEILTEILFPTLPSRTGTAFLEQARRHGDYAMAGVAAVVTLDDDQICRSARLVFLNAGEIPMIAREAAAMLQGERLTPELIEAAAGHAAAHEIDPSGDLHATTGFKRHLAAVLARRAVMKAVERAMLEK